MLDRRKRENRGARKPETDTFIKAGRIQGNRNKCKPQNILKIKENKETGISNIKEK